MKVLVRPSAPWWKNLRAYCQFCECLLEFEGTSDEVRVHEKGDFKDESVLKFTCVECGGTTYTNYSRMVADNKHIRNAGPPK